MRSESYVSTQAEATKQQVENEGRAQFKVRGLRWWIVGLVSVATLINYLDRLTISVLAPVIREDLNLTNLEYASIGTIFLLAYTISQSISGKLFDRIGTRIGFTVSIVIWSLAAMAHALARGLGSLSFFRFLLGLGEAGNWPGAAKAVAEWFPIRERAMGLAIFNSGAAMGSVFAPPIIVWLQLTYGWKATFVITGAIGFVWLAAWLVLYRHPEEHPWLTKDELHLIREGQKVDGVTESKTAPGWTQLLRYRQVWAVVIARLMVDPVWWLFIFWLPEYLNKARGFSLKEIGMFAWAPYACASAGSLFGGWLAGALIKRGWSVNRARKTVIVFAAMLMPAGIIAVRAEDPYVAVGLIGLVLFGFQVWINNVQTLPSDFFPSNAVASVAGMGGTGAGIGSMIFTLSTGWMVDHFSYTPVLTIAGLLAPVGTVLLFMLAGRIQRVPLEPAMNVSTQK